MIVPYHLRGNVHNLKSFLRPILRLPWAAVHQHLRVCFPKGDSHPPLAGLTSLAAPEARWFSLIALPPLLPTVQAF